MSIDTTSVVHICPLCDEEFNTQKQVMGHVSGSSDEEHQGVNGFKMDKTIMTKEKNQWDVESERELHNKIAKTEEYFDSIYRDEVNLVASKAGVSMGRVMRVFEDEGIDYEITSNADASSFDDLTEKQKAVLDEWNGKSDSRQPHDLVDVINEKHEDISVSSGYPKYTIDKYEWLKLPIYDSDKFEGSSSHDGEVSVNNTADEMMECVSSMQPVNEDPETESSSIDPDEVTQQDVFEALVDSDVEFTIVKDDDEFTVISKLIKSGHDEVAEHLFK